MYLISTGSGNADQVKTLAVLLQTISGVQLSSMDGLSVIRTSNNGTLTYAPDTGKPVRWEWDGTPEATIEFIASYQVDSSKLLDLAAAQSTSPPEVPTSTTTIVPGEPVVGDATPAVPAGHPLPTVAPTVPVPTTSPAPVAGSASKGSSASNGAGS